MTKVKQRELLVDCFTGNTEKYDTTIIGITITSWGTKHTFTLHIEDRLICYTNRLGIEIPLIKSYGYSPSILVCNFAYLYACRRLLRFVKYRYRGETYYATTITNPTCFLRELLQDYKGKAEEYSLELARCRYPNYRIRRLLLSYKNICSKVRILEEALGTNIRNECLVHKSVFDIPPTLIAERKEVTL